MCKELEPNPSGRIIENKRTGEKIYDIFELTEKQCCRQCIERFHCRIIELLERKINI